MQAVEAAKTAAKNISETMAEDSDSSKENETEASDKEEESENEEDKRRKAALDKLEKASEDTLLGQASLEYELQQCDDITNSMIWCAVKCVLTNINDFITIIE